MSIERAGISWLIAAALALGGCGGGDSADGAGDGAEAEAGEAGLQGSRWGAVTQIELTRMGEEGDRPGFDLDGVNSPPGGDGPCPFTDGTDEDGRTGIDNQLAELTPILEQFVGGAVDGLIQGAVNEGRLLLLFEVSEDPAEVTIRRGDGKPYLGTDGLILDSQTFAVADEPPLATTTEVEIDEDGVIEAAIPELLLPVSILRENFHLHLVRVRMRLHPADDGGWQGLLGGGFPVDTMVDVAYRASEYEGRRMEGPIRALADLAPEDGACTQMSAALEIRAVPAYVFPDSDDSETPEGEPSK